MWRLRRGILFVAAAVLAACGGGADAERALSDGRVARSVSPESPRTAMITTTTSTVTTTSSVAPATPTTLTTTPGFSGEISAADEELLGSSWRSGCPVAVADLRLITVVHHGIDGSPETGEMVVHVDHAEALLTVFETLFDAGFPIERMELITAYAGDDNASMRANNSSAFNCRLIDGTNRWSQHAYGTAVDINPLVNPWVRGSTVDPPEGAAHLDREAETPGLIRADDVVVQAFEAIGWSWGGYWTGSVDYQHFSANGR